MRLVKLNADEFPEERHLLAYFDRELSSRTPPGLFRFTKGRIAEGALDPGETVLFSYRGRLRFVAQTETARMDNSYLPDDDYPHCFIINMKTVRSVDVPLEELENRLRAEAGLDVSLRGHGWTRIPDSQRAERAVEALL